MSVAALSTHKCLSRFPFPIFSFLTFVLPPRPLLAAPPHFRKYNIRVEDIMVRDVRFITLNSSYRELQEMLVTSYLKTLALVESRGERGTPGETMLSLSLTKSM